MFSFQKQLQTIILESSCSKFSQKPPAVESIDHHIWIRIMLPLEFWSRCFSEYLRLIVVPKSSHRRWSIKKSVLIKFRNTNFRNIRNLISRDTRKYLRWSLFLLKFINLYQKETPTQVIYCEYCKFFKNCERLLCVICFIRYHFSNSYRIVTSCLAFVTTYICLSKKNSRSMQCNLIYMYRE